MQEIITRAGCFIAIIILGFALRRIGLFREEDFRVLSNVVIRITLPASIVISFSSRQIDPSMLSVILLGLGGGVIYMALGYLANLRNTRENRAFAVLNLSGYNIGNFTLPFVQSFLGPNGVIITSLFDTGNAVVCLGGAYGAASMVKDGNGFSVKRIAKALLQSVPFLTYLIMASMNLARIALPAAVLSFAQIAADANAFMAMLMIGVGFRLTGDRTQIGSIIKLLAIRYSVAAVLAGCFYFLLPFSLEIRQTLTILAFGPIASAAPAFTGEMKGDVGLSSAVNSISIIISILIIVTMLSVML
ncbi:MAG: AEC family transporter [Lachnospiraceae bacterium]|nr:AEC family transporter [Lachnospiraceae bacterium]